MSTIIAAATRFVRDTFIGSTVCIDSEIVHFEVIHTVAAKQCSPFSLVISNFDYTLIHPCSL